jgi:hypothetical protein
LDWTIVITRNHALLVRIVAELFAMLRMVDGDERSPLRFAAQTPVPGRATGLARPAELQRVEVEQGADLTSPRRGEGSAQPTERGLPSDGKSFPLPRHLYAAIMLILRPCESAIRRLIIIAARGLVLKPRAAQPIQAGAFSFSNAGLVRAPRFQLIDPLKQFSPDLWDQTDDHAGSMHAMAVFNPALAYQQAQSMVAPVNAALLFNRLRAMRLALNDLPRQARRLARWQARQNLAFKANTPYRPMRMSPFRPGPPPGYRRKDAHQVYAVLKEVRYFALQGGLPDRS